MNKKNLIPKVKIDIAAMFVLGAAIDLDENTLFIFIGPFAINIIF
jgi:hypothetical protein